MTPMQQAKARMALRHVFFASIVLSTELVVRNDIPTAATDMVKIYYNETFINGLDAEIVMFVVAHEVFHIILKHGIRRGSRNADLWNQACDYAINLQLKDAGFTIWKSALIDYKFSNMSAEQIYDHLLRDQEQEGGGNGGNGRKGNGHNNDGIGRDLMDVPTHDPNQIAEIEQKISQKVAVAATQARMAGKMPAGLDILVRGLLNPEVPWPDLLREYMLATVSDGESWSRRNRRFHHAVLPGHYSEHMGELVIIGDTSGSTNFEGYYSRIATEMNFIKDMVKPERTRVIWADAEECSNEEVFEPGDDIVLHPKGGGGTDMRLPLKYVEKYEPGIVVLVTDGYTPWPDDVPYPLIVLCTSNVEAPIGRTIHVTT
jgi:predicted metal-dependent peptidase